MRILPLLLVGGFASVAHAQVADTSTVAVAAVDVSGTYSSTWGAMTLQQSGTHVTGTYAYHDGRIDGTLDGNTLRFAWTERRWRRARRARARLRRHVRRLVGERQRRLERRLVATGTGVGGLDVRTGHAVARDCRVGDR